jgi:lipoyl(octanoyl) transferase
MGSIVALGEEEIQERQLATGAANAGVDDFDCGSKRRGDHAPLSFVLDLWFFVFCSYRSDKGPRPKTARPRFEYNHFVLELYQLGRSRYAPVLELQRRFVQQRQRGEIPDRLILVEHEPVITLGPRAAPRNILVDAEILTTRGIELHRVERGGDVTFHGPGQLVGYPIIHLRERHISGPRQYVRMLEETLIQALADYGVEAFRQPGHIGVWTNRGKIAAIGVSISRGVTMHGFALNVNTDLNYFQLIVPCGLRDSRVATLDQWLHQTVTLPEVEPRLVAAFVRVFGYAASKIVDASHGLDDRS